MNKATTHERMNGWVGLMDLDLELVGNTIP